MKKVLSLTGLLSVVLLFVHMIVFCCTYAGTMQYSSAIKTSGKILIVFILIHFICNVIEDCTRKNNKRQHNGYKRINNEFYMQKLTGYIGMVFIILHVIFIPKTLLQSNELMATVCSIIEIILDILLFSHLNLSIPRVFITLGMVNTNKSYKVLQLFTVMVNVIIFLFVIKIQCEHYVMLF